MKGNQQLTSASHFSTHAVCAMPACSFDVYLCARYSQSLVPPVALDAVLFGSIWVCAGCYGLHNHCSNWPAYIPCVVQTFDTVSGAFDMVCSRVTCGLV